MVTGKTSPDPEGNKCRGSSQEPREDPLSSSSGHPHQIQQLPSWLLLLPQGSVWDAPFLHHLDPEHDGCPLDAGHGLVPLLAGHLELLLPPGWWDA